MTLNAPTNDNLFASQLFHIWNQNQLLVPLNENKTNIFDIIQQI